MWKDKENKEKLDQLPKSLKLLDQDRQFLTLSKTITPCINFLLILSHSLQVFIILILLLKAFLDDFCSFWQWKYPNLFESGRHQHNGYHDRLVGILYWPQRRDPKFPSRMQNDTNDNMLQTRSLKWHKHTHNNVDYTIIRTKGNNDNNEVHKQRSLQCKKQLSKVI